MSELGKHFAESFVTQSDAGPTLKLELEVFRFIWSLLRSNAELVHVPQVRSAGIDPRIFQNPAFVTDMEQITIHRVWLFRRRSHRYSLLFRVRNHFAPARKGCSELLQTPRRDDLEVGL